MNGKITDIDELLSREAALSVQQLCSGLTAIRKYDFSSKGVFYSGMFSITIGLERVLKLILLLDYKINNGCYPDNNYLKDKGHKIKKLIRDAVSIHNTLNDESGDNILSDLLIRKIVNFLTEFSMSTRYYNLDVVTGSNPRGNEPLAHWDNEICSIILKRYLISKKKKQEYKVLANSLRDISSVYHTHENGSHIDDVDCFFEHSSYIDEKQGYSVFYLFKIIDFSVNLLKSLDHKMTHQLYLREHFTCLAMYNPTCSNIRKRKLWCKI